MRGLIYFPGRRPLAKQLTARLAVPGWTFRNMTSCVASPVEIVDLLEERGSIGEPNDLAVYEALFTTAHLFGFELAKQIRTRGIPTDVVVLGVSDMNDEIELLQAGVRYCAHLPVNLQDVERLAKAILGILPCAHATAKGNGIVSVEFLTLDVNRFTLTDTRTGREVVLTLTECRLLLCLMRHPQQLFTKGYLMRLRRDEAREVDERSVGSHVKRVRGKLKELLGDPGRDVVSTHYSGGYILNTALLRDFPPLRRERHLRTVR